MLTQQNLKVHEPVLARQTAQATRLVVLVPEQETDEVRFGRAICALAEPRRLEIVLVTIVSEIDQELSARRRLATIATYMRELKFSVSTHVQWNKSWLQALRAETRPGDLLVYPPEITLRDGLFKHVALGLALSPLEIPLHPLPGFFYRTLSQPWQQILHRLAYWGGLALTLAIFFALESATTSSVPGTLGHLLAVMIVFGEFGVVYLWTAVAG
jgi:hypothetical protein